MSIEDYYDLAAIGLCKAGITYKGEVSKFSTYAYKVMFNEMMQDKRKKRIPQHQIVYYEAEIETHDGDTASFLDFMTSDKNVESDSLAKVMFDECLKQLKDKEKQIILLFGKGYKQQEICKIVGCSQSYVSRTKKKLEDYLNN